MLEYNGQHIDEINSLLKGTDWLLIEGFKIADNEGFKDGEFGYRSATDRCISNIYHEVAHAIELFLDDPKKLSKEGFDFTLPREFFYDRWVCEPTTTQMTDRELRTFAIQAHIMKNNALLPDFDLNQFIDDSARLLIYLPDWLNVPVNCNENNPDLNREESRINWCKNRIAENLACYNLTDIKALWPRVMKKITSTN